MDRAIPQCLPRLPHGDRGDLVAEGDKVAASFKCSGTHQGDWQGHAPTGRRFERVDEIYIFEVKDGRLQGAVAVEDNLTRMRQLEFEL